jgi:hypothetical protein
MGGRPGQFRRRRKKANIFVALHPVVLAAYDKYASGHGIRDAFLPRRSSAGDLGLFTVPSDPRL